MIRLHRSTFVAGLLASAGLAHAQFAGFTPDVISDVASFNGLVVDMTTGDINNDGVPDVVYITSSGRVAAFSGAANGQLQGGAATLLPADASDTGRAIDLFDCNGDGINDLMRADTRDGGSLRIYKNNGAGEFIFDFAIIGLGPISATRGLSMGDYDADGDADAYVLTNDGVTVVLNDNGTFNATPVVNTFVNFDGSRLAVADLDGDNRDDAVAFSTFNNQIYVLEAGPFGLSDADRIPFASGVNDLKLFDIDEDGDQDLVAAGNSTNDTIGVYRNDGAGNLELAYSLVEPNPDEVEVADMDGDGDPDLVVEAEASTSSGFSERAIVYTNNGSGFFDRNDDEWFFATTDVLHFDIVNMVESSGNDIVGIFGTNSSGSNARVTLRINDTPFSSPAPFPQVSPADNMVEVAIPTQVDAWGGGTTPTLRWERADGLGITYSVRLDNDVDFSSPEFTASGLTNKAVSLAGVDLSPGTIYFWEVEATNAFGTTLSSNGPFSFVTAIGPSDCPADINGDGFLDTGDITVFVALFLAGCP